MNPNSKAFAKLQAEWYKKAAKSGFEDIEQSDGRLKTWMTGILKKRVSIEAFKAKETYFQLVGQFLHSHKFESEEDSLIWKYHAEGLSTHQIARFMAKKHKIKRDQTTIAKAIVRLKNIMLKEIGKVDDNNE